MTIESMDLYLLWGNDYNWYNWWHFFGCVNKKQEFIMQIVGFYLDIVPYESFNYSKAHKKWSMFHGMCRKEHFHVSKVMSNQNWVLLRMSFSSIQLHKWLHDCWIDAVHVLKNWKQVEMNIWRDIYLIHRLPFPVSFIFAPLTLKSVCEKCQY